MSLTYAAQTSDTSVRKSGTIIFVVLLHVGFLYAFTHGMNVVNLVTPIKRTVAVFIPEQKPQETPPQPVIKPLDRTLADLPSDVPAKIDIAVMPDVFVEPTPGPSTITAEVGGAPEIAPARSFAITHQVSPQYPAASRRAGESGTVLLDIVIGPNGAPTEINVERSSGYTALDQAAVTAVRLWRFTVSSDASYARVHLPVSFRLEAGR
jgi:protein TonB